MDTATGPTFQRVLAVLVGLATLTAAVLAAGELETSQRADRASARAAAAGVDVFSGYVGSSLRRNVESDVLGRLGSTYHDAAMSIIATMRDGPVPLTVEQELAGRLDRALRPLIGQRTKQTLETEFTRQTQRVKTRLAAQQAQIAAATSYSHDRSRLVLALSIVAVAAGLFGLAGAAGASRTGWIAIGSGLAAWLLSLAVGISAVLL